MRGENEGEISRKSGESKFLNGNTALSGKVDCYDVFWLIFVLSVHLDLYKLDNVDLNNKYIYNRSKETNNIIIRSIESSLIL